MQNQNIVQLIKEKQGSFSKQQLKIAAYLIDNYKKVVFQTATQIARDVGVSQPTVIRFTQSLGFPQYNMFIEAFRKILNEELTSIDRLNISFKNDLNHNSSFLDILAKEINTLKHLVNEFPEKQFNSLVQQICKSDRVFIVGNCGSASLAHYFAYFLAKVKSNVSTVTNGSTESYNLLSYSGKNDLVIPIAFPRYPRETIEITNYCKTRKLEVIGISDKINSPLAQVVSQLIVIPISFSTLFDSYCSAFCLFNSIVTEVGKLNRDESEQLSKSFETLAREIKTFL